MGNESIAFLKTEQNRLYCYAQNQSEAIKNGACEFFLSQVPYFCYVLTANLMTLLTGSAFFLLWSFIVFQVHPALPAPGIEASLREGGVVIVGEDQLIPRKIDALRGAEAPGG